MSYGDQIKQLRAEAMPTELAAILQMFEARQRLIDLGWQDAAHAPRDGSPISLIEPGSTGIHAAHRDADGTFWIACAGDLWPSEPVLFRPGHPGKNEQEP